MTDFETVTQRAKAIMARQPAPTPAPAPVPGPGPAPTRRYLTITEAAELTRASADGLREWVRSGRLRAYKGPGRSYIILEADLYAFLDARPVVPGPEGNSFLAVSLGEGKETGR